MWVSGRWLDEHRGTTPRKRKGRRQRGLWRQGLEWAWVDGEIQYDVDAIDQRANLVASQQRVLEIKGSQVTRLV